MEKVKSYYVEAKTFTAKTKLFSVPASLNTNYERERSPWPRARLPVRRAPRASPTESRASERGLRCASGATVTAT